MKQNTVQLCHLDCDCWHVIETVLHAAHRTRFVSQCENKTLLHFIRVRNQHILPVWTDIGLVRCDFCQHVWIWCPVTTGSILNFPSYHLSPVEERSTKKTSSRGLWLSILIYCYWTKLWGSSRDCLSEDVSQHISTFPSLMLKSCPHVSEAQFLPGRARFSPDVAL